jgi:hypothetical protein
MKPHIWKWRTTPIRKAEADGELRRFRESALGAAEMFWSVYVEKVDSRPPATEPDIVKRMMPEPEPSATTAS